MEKAITKKKMVTSWTEIDRIVEHEEIHDLIKEGLDVNGIQGDPKNPIELVIWVS